MIKIQPNKIMLFFLVTVFLTAQWTATHIHLAEHHEHDGSHHEHNIHAHAYSAPNLHADTIYLVHVTEDYNVIELDNNCTSSGWKKASDQTALSFSICHSFVFAPTFFNIQLSKQGENKQNYHTYSTIRLRAPPQIS